jgi:hypothetical protein
MKQRLKKSANEFINFILYFMQSEICANTKNLIIWFNNSWVQNKNWLLFSSLITINYDSKIHLNNLTQVFGMWTYLYVK